MSFNDLSVNKDATAPGKIDEKAGVAAPAVAAVVAPAAQPVAAAIVDPAAPKA